MNNVLNLPVVIVGGGISALWTLAKLRANNISAYLFTDNFLGGAQSIASQGMIHGGQRYSLQGLLTNHASISSLMPKVWDDALSGIGDVKFTKTNKLSSYQYLWSPGSLASNITSFFASKVMNTKVNLLEKENYPEILKFKEFNGKVYQLPEIVLDIKSLVNDIYDQYSDFIYKIKIKKIDFDGEIGKLYTEDTCITADKIIYSAGLGNEDFLNLVSAEPLYQRRPLLQVLVKGVELPFYGHAISADPRPRITISAHPYQDKYCYYLGGLVAARNPEATPESAIEYAYSELSELFPQIDWKSKEFSTLYINRAEPKAKNGFLPDEPYVREFGNVVVAYPTKLTFAPETANRIFKLINNNRVENNKLDFEKPEIELYPWEKVEWMKLK